MADTRRRGSGPILILAALFVAATFLAWYFTWFGRELSDADISQYLADEKNPRHVQHALLQIQQRIERGDTTSKNWTPQLIALSNSRETEFRLTVAWLMGFDNSSPEFHQSLLRLVKDPEPLVRRNAALALDRFNDATGSEELVAMLKPFALTAPANGFLASTLREGATVTRGTLLARIEQSDGKIAELRSPLLGRLAKLLKTSGSQVFQNEEVMILDSDENSVWEALRGLALVGTSEDLPAVEPYVYSGEASPRVRDQAKQTVNAIQTRMKNN
jgi:hypothetical protein